MGEISRKLQERGLDYSPWDTNPQSSIPENVKLVSNSQMQAMLTIIRNRETSLSDFVFYSDRICRLLLEHAISFIPSWEDCQVLTPLMETYSGNELKAQVMENSYELCFSDFISLLFKIRFVQLKF